MQPAASPEDGPAFLAAHPLARDLIERFRDRPTARILDFASGRGRNARALREAGLAVVEIDDATATSSDPLAGISGAFAAGLSTHGLLHGRPPQIAASLAALAALLEPGGLLYATFGSERDARFGEGARIDDNTYAPQAGDERGVPHAYFNRAALVALLAPHFAVESIEERDVDEVAGTWAHARQPLARAVHWFAKLFTVS